MEFKRENNWVKNPDTGFAEQSFKPAIDTVIAERKLSEIEKFPHVAVKYDEEGKPFATLREELMASKHVTFHAALDSIASNIQKLVELFGRFRM